jgi:hypothetical protein
MTSDEFWLYYWAMADGFDLLAEAEQSEACVDTSYDTWNRVNYTQREFFYAYKNGEEPPEIVEDETVVDEDTVVRRHRLYSEFVDG